MNALELRIGNLIRYIDTKEPSSIYQIEHRYKKIYRINDINDNDQIEPIPLNEEWLLKFGFHCFGDKNEYFKLDNSPFCFELLNQGIEFTVFDTGGLKVAFCKYVHQLQNLVFALTGEELITPKP